MPTVIGAQSNNDEDQGGAADDFDSGIKLDSKV